MPNTTRAWVGLLSANDHGSGDGLASPFVTYVRCRPELTLIE